METSKRELSPHSAEFREYFSGEIRNAFLMAGDREPIGSVLSFLASQAFENGLGRDEAVRHIVTPEVFGSRGLVEGPLKGCVKHEIETAYGERKGRKKLTPDQRATLRAELEQFLAEMSPHHSVTRFFRDLVHGRTGVGPVITDQVSTTVSRRSVEKWALGRKTTALTKRRFQDLVQPVLVAEYRSHIAKKPEQYIANFLNDVLKISVERIGEPAEFRPQIEFKIGNLKELFRDIHDSITFEHFWKILSAHADASMKEWSDIDEEAGSIHEFLDLELWRTSIYAIWREVENEGTGERESRRGRRPEEFDGQAVERISRQAAKDLAHASRVNFVIQPPGSSNGGSASPHKMAIEVQKPDGTKLAVAFVKPDIGRVDPGDIRRYVRRLLAGSDSRLANELHAQRVFLASDGPEVEALTAQLKSFGSLRRSPFTDQARGGRKSRR